MVGREMVEHYLSGHPYGCNCKGVQGLDYVMRYNFHQPEDHRSAPTRLPVN